MIRFVYILLFLLVFTSCGKEQGDILSFSSELDTEVPTVTPYLVINGQDSNHQGFAIYNLDGTFVSGGNFRAENATPRGMFPYDNNSFLISLDTTDSIFHVNLDGTKTIFHGSALFSGNIYGIVIAPNKNIYAVESNVIEVFDPSGVRLSTSLINTTTGACTLNTPRGMTLNANGNLVVVNQGATDNVLTYDISTTPATCLSSIPFGNNPYGVILHSDGYLYITTQLNNRVYRADPNGANPVVVWNTDNALINNPTGLVELENGDLLIASSSTDTVERITTLGTRVGTTPFIQDTNSLNIGDMIIVGQSP